MRHIRAISQKPHPVGSPELAIVRDYIGAQLRTIGLESSTQHTLATRQTRADVLLAGEVTNVMTRLAGAESNRAILLMAHYDTVSTSPGAVDNASGVAVLLETMRALKSGTPLNHDVIALFTDGEEAALLGAQAFVDEHSWMADVKVALNMGLLYRGPPVIWSTN
jgi:acetylornithine deacetylase/succinyl-diaminopimelate desuccinylase-like protein